MNSSDEISGGIGGGPVVAMPLEAVQVHSPNLIDTVRQMLDSLKENAMTRVVMSLVLAWTSVVFGFGQDEVSPDGPHQPVIVKRLVVKRQTQLLGSLTSPIPFFTPDHNGFFRVTLYLQAAGNPKAKCSEIPNCTGLFLVNGLNGLATFAAGTGGSAVDAFPGATGQPIGYFTQQENAGTTPLPYDFIIIVEEL
jgi:hypothetical protein